MAIAIISVFTPLIVFGEGLCAVLSSYLLLPVMRAVSKTPEEIEQMKRVQKVEEAQEDDAE